MGVQDNLNWMPGFIYGNMIHLSKKTNNIEIFTFEMATVIKSKPGSNLSILFSFTASGRCNAFAETRVSGPGLSF